MEGKSLSFYSIIKKKLGKIEDSRKRKSLSFYSIIKKLLCKMKKKYINRITLKHLIIELDPSIKIV